MNRLEHLYREVFTIFEAVYQCTNCGYKENSEDMTPENMMQGDEAICPKCGAQMEAVWGHSTMKGYVPQPLPGKITR